MRAAPTFHVVFAVPPFGDEFRVYGAFTLRADADALVSSIEDSPSIGMGACVDEMSFDALAEHIYRDRLGKLAPLIKALEGSIATTLTLPVEQVAELQLDLTPAGRRG